MGSRARTASYYARERCRLRVGVAAAALTAALGLCAPVAGAAAPTVVSIEFDDGSRGQYETRAMLAEHGMQATFYVNSGRIGTGSYYMTWEQVAGLHADGNDIGGHTVDHTDLRGLPAEEQRAAVCDDRAALAARGFDPTEFAYPYGHFDASAQQAVRDCGYRSGRGVSGIRSGTVCASCPPAEAIPPLNAYRTRTPANVDGSTTLETIKGFVTQAEEAGGGWVQIVFHRICDACNEAYRATPALFDAFLDWLQPRAAHGTVVRTVQQVMRGGGLEPPPPPPADTIAPDTIVTEAPSGTVTAAEASFAFTATEQAAFECNADRAGWSACTSPARVTGLRPGKHVFEVRARDLAGNLDATPASVTWTVDPGTGSAKAPQEGPSPAAEPQPVPQPQTQAPAPAPAERMLLPGLRMTDLDPSRPLTLWRGATHVAAGRMHASSNVRVLARLRLRGARRSPLGTLRRTLWTGDVLALRIPLTGLARRALRRSRRAAVELQLRVTELPSRQVGTIRIPLSVRAHTTSRGRS